MNLTRQEVFQALADGKNIEFKGLAWGTDDDFITLFADGGDYSRLNEFEAYDWRIKSEPPKWYENIPSHGVLCWVSDLYKEPNYSNSSLTIIVSVRTVIDHRVYKSRYGVEYLNVTPLTNDEIKQFLTGE